VLGGTVETGGYDGKAALAKKAALRHLTPKVRPWEEPL
jgi:hypothetical protein